MTRSKPSKSFRYKQHTVQNPDYHHSILNLSATPAAYGLETDILAFPELARKLRNAPRNIVFIIFDCGSIGACF